MEFLYDGWYVAAWADEIGHALMPRRFLDIPVVLYRKTSGEVVAMQDQCPHRFAPLHLGALEGDEVKCGYHGLRFGADGKCTHNPYSQKTPAAARVRIFPTFEKDTIIWIWMGNPANADPETIIDCGYITDTQHWRTVKGYTRTEGNYALVIDNLMDLTHSQYLHGDSFGSDALLTAHYQVSGDGRTVHSNRWYDRGPSLPLLEHFLPTNGQPVEHWVHMRWDAPSNLVLDLGMTIAGNRREEGWMAMSPNLLTPETASTTHYFFSYSRNMYLDSAEVDALLSTALAKAFDTEDAPMIKAIYDEVGDYDGLTPVLLPGDAGSVRARRVLSGLIAQARSEGNLTKQKVASVAE